MKSSSAPVAYTIGGTVSGLSGTGLVLQNNGGNNLSVSANGSFTFTTAIASGSTFNVTVFSQPSNPAQTCGVTAGGSGTVASTNVTSVVVTCIGSGSAGFVLTGSMISARDSHTATLLNNGKVLIAGGFRLSSLASAELYDPATGSFTVTGSMTAARSFYTATLLNNGNVLVMGGVTSPAAATALASGELYNPVTGSFTATGSMTNVRAVHTATLLNNGNVLVAGGSNPTTALASAELYVPSTLTPTGLVSITVTPATPTLSVGSTQQFIATGSFSNGSMQNLQSVTWSSSNQVAGTITNDASDHGVALALAAGKSTITSSAGSISASTVLTVQ